MRFAKLHWHRIDRLTATVGRRIATDAGTTVGMWRNQHISTGLEWGCNLVNLEIDAPRCQHVFTNYDAGDEPTMRCQKCGAVLHIL